MGSRILNWQSCLAIPPSQAQPGDTHSELTQRELDGTLQIDGRKSLGEQLRRLTFNVLDSDYQGAGSGSMSLYSSLMRESEHIMIYI